MSWRRLGYGYTAHVVDEASTKKAVTDIVAGFGIQANNLW